MAVPVKLLSWGVVLTLVILIGMWYVYSPRTTIDIEISGGFAYITPATSSGDNHVEVAYLNSWTYKEDVDPAKPGDETICDVHQIGTELKLITGTLKSFAPSTYPMKPTREIDLDGATVTIPAIEDDNQGLVIKRQAGFPPAPKEPADPDSDPEWEDLKWVPSLSEYFATQTPPHTLDPNWRNIVNGSLRLRGGSLRAGYPTNSRFRRGRLDFKRNGVSTNNVVAATDKTVYQIKVPNYRLSNGNLEILFSGSKKNLTRIEIEPVKGVIALTLTGLHDMSAPIPGPDAELKDFCTFHQLLQPPVRASEFLRPHYKAAASGPGSGGSPSPGWFCPGDWF